MKGGGGALVRERLVADAAARFLVLVDEPKLVASLDEWGVLPVAVVPFGAARAAHELADLSPRRRPGRSDDGLVILDLQVPAGSDWRQVAARASAASGVVDQGLFEVGAVPGPRRAARTAPGGPRARRAGRVRARRYDPRVPPASAHPRPRRRARLSRRLGRGGGTSLPGKILLRMRPDALAELGGELPRGVTLISATNGKTTTARLVASCAREAGWDLVANPSGANLLSGVATALLDARAPHARPARGRPVRGGRGRARRRWPASSPRGCCC